MDPINTVEQTGAEAAPSQATEATPEVKPIQREEEAIGALFDKAEQKQQAASEVQEPTGRKEETRTEPQDSGQQAEAPAHWSEEDKALFKSQPKEVQDFLLRRNKDLESDYGRKTQQLAGQRKQLEALSFIAEKMKYDEGYRAHVLSYGETQGKKDSQQGQQPPENTPPDDPIEQIVWQAEQNVMKKIQAEKDMKAKEAYNEKIISTMTAAQADPMFDQVQEGILGFINVLPEPLRPVMYDHLNLNPDAYRGVFDMVKQALTSKKPTNHNQKQPEATTLTAPQRRETVHKPLIEQGGVSEEINTESRRFKDIRKKASGGDLHAIGAMFDFKK